MNEWHLNMFNIFRLIGIILQMLVRWSKLCYMDMEMLESQPLVPSSISLSRQEPGYANRLEVSKSRVAPISPLTISRFGLRSSTHSCSPYHCCQGKRFHLWSLFRILAAGLRTWLYSTGFSPVRSTISLCRTRLMGFASWLMLDVRNWQHCPGEYNPADVGSRECLASGLKTSHIC